MAPHDKRSYKDANGRRPSSQPRWSCLRNGFPKKRCVTSKGSSGSGSSPGFTSTPNGVHWCAHHAEASDGASSPHALPIIPTPLGFQRSSSTGSWETHCIFEGATSSRAHPFWISNPMYPTAMRLRTAQPAGWMSWTTRCFRRAKAPTRSILKRKKEVAASSPNTITTWMARLR